MLSDNDIKTEMKNTTNEISQKYINNILFSLKKQRNNRMLQKTLKEYNKNLRSVSQRKLSKILANQMSIPGSKYAREFKDKFNNILINFRDLYHENSKHMVVEE